MELSDLEAALQIVSASSETVGDFGVVWLEQPPRSSTADNERLSQNTADLPVAERLHSCEYCEWGYFGNEASDVDFYIYAALHIQIPAKAERLRAVTPPKAGTKRKSAKVPGVVSVAKPKEFTDAVGTRQPVKKKTGTIEKPVTAIKKKTAKPVKKKIPKTNPDE